MPQYIPRNTCPAPCYDLFCFGIIQFDPYHYGDVIMGAIASQITSLTLVYSTFYSDAHQRKHQSSASLAFVRGIHRGLPAQMASNAENVSICWRHHVIQNMGKYITEYSMKLLFDIDKTNTQQKSWPIYQSEIRTQFVCSCMITKHERVKTEIMKNGSPDIFKFKDKHIPREKTWYKQQLDYSKPTLPDSYIICCSNIISIPKASV